MRSLVSTIQNILYLNLRIFDAHHGHGLKRESGIKNKWRSKSVRFVEPLQSTIILFFWSILAIFDNLILPELVQTN